MEVLFFNKALESVSVSGKTLLSDRLKTIKSDFWAKYLSVVS